MVRHAALIFSATEGFSVAPAASRRLIFLGAVLFLSVRKAEHDQPPPPAASTSCVPQQTAAPTRNPWRKATTAPARTGPRSSQSPGQIPAPKSQRLRCTLRPPLAILVVHNFRSSSGGRPDGRSLCDGGSGSRSLRSRSLIVVGSGVILAAAVRLGHPSEKRRRSLHRPFGGPNCQASVGPGLATGSRRRNRDHSTSGN